MGNLVMNCMIINSSIDRSEIANECQLGLLIIMIIIIIIILCRMAKRGIGLMDCPQYSREIRVMSFLQIKKIYLWRWMRWLNRSERRVLKK